MTTLFRRLFVALLIGAQLVWSAPLLAATPRPRPPSQAVHIRVSVRNAADGSAVPDMLVHYDELVGYCSVSQGRPSPPFSDVETTGPEGVVEFTREACVGAAAVTVRGNTLFGAGGQEFNIVTGTANYNFTLQLAPRRQRAPSDRTLNIQVRGRLANGSLVPVHFATVYDRSGRHVVTTDYNGNATAYVREAIGETVTVKAEGSHWRDGTASFIVGASTGTRLTRNDDYVMIVLNGENANAEEEFQLGIQVWGTKMGRRVAVHFASIYDASGKHLVTTDYSGRATVKVKAQLGESYVVKAESGHWKPATQSVIAGSAGGAGPTSTSMNVVFNLQPEGNEKKLTVEVLDHDTNKPVPAVTVTLYRPTSFPGTPVARGLTGHLGELTFDAEQVDSAMLNGQARLGATFGGSDPTMQTLSSSLMNADLPRYVIYIKGKQEVTRWSGTWYDGPYVIQVSGGTGSLGYTFKRCDPSPSCSGLLDEGGGSCTVAANVATCQSHAHYKDAAKDVVRGGHDTLMFSRGLTPDQDTIATKNTVDTATITLTTGTCPDINQCTSMHPGATFPGTWRRKKS